MSLKNKLYELAKTDENLMMAIEDVKTFHHMRIGNHLRVTDPEAYETQNKNLEEIRESYTEIITNVIKKLDVLKWVVDETITDISPGMRGFTAGYITADNIHTQ